MKTIICTCLLFALSCTNTNKNITNEDLNILINKSSMLYFQTKEKKHLETAYKSLKYNKDFSEKGLSGKNSLPIISLLMNLKKYDELDKLLAENKTINEYNRKNTLNIVRYLNNFEKDRVKSKSYINENIKRINDSIRKAPKDSLLYADYFSMRMFLKGKATTLKEIDSMQTINKKYSEMFYKSILKETIEAYPDENLPVK